jgi:hypothetical protein
MADVLIPQFEFSTFQTPVAEDLLAALDDDCRRDVIAIMAKLDDPTRRALLDAVDELDRSGAEAASLLAIFKGKPHDVPVSAKSLAAMRRLIELVRQCRGSGNWAGVPL